MSVLYSLKKKKKKYCVKVLKYYKYEFLNNYWNVIWNQFYFKTKLLLCFKKIYNNSNKIQNHFFKGFQFLN